MYKVIWIYWHQGWGSAPDLVKAVRESWGRLNPSHSVISLDFHSLDEYVNLQTFCDLEGSHLIVQEISNFVRLELLQLYGGIWGGFILKSLMDKLGDLMSVGELVISHVKN